MRGRDLGLLLLLGASFGSSFLFIRVAAPEFGPAPLMAVRLALAAVVLFAYARARGHAVAFAGDRARWWLMGIFNAALPFTLIAWAELRITSSLAAVLIATMPLFTSLVSAVWTKTALRGPQRVGLALGLVGVLVLSGGGSIDLGVRGVLPILALLTASLSYAVGNVFVKQRFAGVPRLTLTIGNFAAAGVVLLPVAAASPAPAPDGGAWAALAALVLLATVVPYLLYFGLLERASAPVAASVGYLVPAFGAAWGAIFLGEPITIAMVVGFVVVLASVALVAGAAPTRLLRRVRPPAPGRAPGGRSLRRALRP
jgi:drug/metabolite transporter (DMT)-like permease